MLFRSRCACWVWLLAASLATACGPEDPLERARALQGERHFAASLEALRPVVEEGSDDPEVYYRYGLALLTTGQPTLALWPLQRAAEAPDWESPARLSLISAHLAAGSHDQAIELAGRELQKDPDSVPALVLRAEARVASRRHYEEALADTARVLELEPDNTQVLPSRAVALLALERVEEATEALQELESLYADPVLGLKGSSGYCTARAKFAEEKGQLGEAAKRYEDCLEHFPANGALAKEAMAFFEMTGEPERATRVLRGALEAQPDSQSIRLALATRLRDLGDGEGAERLLREGTERADPRVAAESWASLARFLIDTERYAEAVDAYREVVRLAGPDDVLLFATADALVMAKRPEEARALAGRISHPPYRQLVLGRVALAQHEPARALAHFRAGLREWPDNPFGRYYAAIAAEQLGDFDRAIDDYRYAMRIDAKATDAYLRLARLQEAAGRLEDALATLRFMPGDRQLETEAAQQELRILARQGKEAVPPRILGLLSAPALRGAGTAAMAEGIRARAGPAAAAEAIRATTGVDLTDPRQIDALDALVGHLVDGGDADAARAASERALAAHPTSAAFQAVRGRALALTDRAASRAAFERALEIDPAERRALLGLARLEAADGEAEAALALFERVLANDPADRAAARGAGAQLVALARPEAAEERYAELLREHPYDAEAALALARLRVARGVGDERTREFARRALLFGAAEAAPLLERLGSGETNRPPAG